MNFILFFVTSSNQIYSERIESIEKAKVEESGRIDWNNQINPSFIIYIDSLFLDIGSITLFWTGYIFSIDGFYSVARVHRSFDICIIYLKF